MGLTNSKISYTGLVEKYVGTAYDRMAELHSELEALLLISKSIEDGSFSEVAEISDEISTLIAKLDEFNATYYGALANAPVLDPFGNSITDGDLYFDTTHELMYVFMREYWVPLGAVKIADQHVIIANTHINGDIIKIEALHDPYIPGSNNLSVHRNGELLLPKSESLKWGEFREVDERTIEMYLPIPDQYDDDGNLKEKDVRGTKLNDKIHIRIGTEAATVVYVGKVGQEVVPVNITGTTLVYLPDGVNYVTGSYNLTVHKRAPDAFDIRELQLVGVDYDETSPTSVNFTQPLEAGTEITFTVGHITGNDSQIYLPIMSAGAPATADLKEGQMWFKTDTGRLFILYEDNVPDEAGSLKQWVSVAAEDNIIDPEYTAPPTPLPTIIHGTVFQDRAPDPSKFTEGTLWFNVNTANLHIKYYDGNSHQWVKVST